MADLDAEEETPRQGLEREQLRWAARRIPGPRVGLRLRTGSHRAGWAAEVPGGPGRTHPGGSRGRGPGRAVPGGIRSGAAAQSLGYLIPTRKTTRCSSRPPRSPSSDASWTSTTASGDTQPSATSPRSPISHPRGSPLEHCTSTHDDWVVDQRMKCPSTWRWPLCTASIRGDELEVAGFQPRSLRRLLSQHDEPERLVSSTAALFVFGGAHRCMNSMTSFASIP